MCQTKFWNRPPDRWGKQEKAESKRRGQTFKLPDDGRFNLCPIKLMERRSARRACDLRPHLAAAHDAARVPQKSRRRKNLVAESSSRHGLALECAKRRRLIMRRARGSVAKAARPRVGGIFRLTQDRRSCRRPRRRGSYVAPQNVKRTAVFVTGSSSWPWSCWNRPNSRWS